jgi:hypothetical protein
MNNWVLEVEGVDVEDVDVEDVACTVVDDMERSGVGGGQEYKGRNDGGSLASVQGCGDSHEVSASYGRVRNILRHYSV